jgi:hypothetical protein
VIDHQPDVFLKDIHSLSIMTKASHNVSLK